MLTKLGKYEIRRELGRGAMGIVYEGFDPLIERAVAIKTIQKSLIDQAEAAEIFSRFRREAQAAGRLAHPNIVSIFEYGEEGDMAFIAMELLAGAELKEYFDKAKKFRIHESTNIMLQLLDALEYSHGRGVIHRDIKPSNILITQNGKIKIADFGIAKIESSDLTHVGTVLGTPTYMSPEQFMGLAADRRSDIYSAGVIFYQLLTGERPFNGSNMNIIMQKVMHQSHIPPSELSSPGISKAIDEVVKKALAKRPEERFQTALEFMNALNFALSHPNSSAYTSDMQATVKFSAQNLSHASNDLSASLAFDMADFEKRLKETQQETSRVLGQSVIPKKIQDIEQTIITAVPAAAIHTAPLKEPAKVAAESGLLARLAREAKENLDSIQSLGQENHARARRVHDTLDRIFKFLTPFIQHVNNIEHKINRTYRLDARTIFANLKWQDATIDFRKLNLAEESHIAYVVFNVNLSAPEPVLIKRPWDQFDALKNELHHLRLQVIDDLEELYKKPKQEWLQAHLSPSLQIQLLFKGNYENGTIDIATRNIEELGPAAFKLQPEDITPELLDDLGLYLIGRTDKPPKILRHI